MKKIFIVFVFLFFLVSCSVESEKIINKNFNTGSVFSGSLDSSSSFVGYLEGQKNTQLSFKSAGRITNMYVDAGEKVEKGQLLAELDGAEAKTGFSSAGNIISNLEGLQNSTSQSFDNQIEATNSQIIQLKKSLELAQINFSGANNGLTDTNKITQSQIKTVENQILQAEVGLENSRENYQNLQNTLNQKEEDIFTNSKNSITSANVLGNNIFDYLDNLFGITEANKNNNSAIKNFLGAKNSQQKIELENQIILGMQKFDNLEQNSKNTNSREQIKNNLENYYDFFQNDIKELLSLSYEVIENSVVSAEFGQSQINELKNQITTFQRENEQIILNVSGNFIVGLKGSLDSIKNISNEKKQSFDNAQKQIENMEAQLDILNQTLNTYKNESDSKINQSTTGLEQSQKQIEIVKSQIAEAKSGLEALKSQKKSALLEIQTQISQTESSQNEAGVMIDNTKIIAPFSGVVTQKFLDEGTVVGAGNPVFEISNNDVLKLEINVGDEIISNLNLGQEVNVKIDNYDDFLSFEVTKIFPNIDFQTKKTKVELSFDNSQKIAKIGDFARAYFDFGTGIKTLVPNNSITTKYISPGVFVLENGIAKFYKIQIIESDENFSHIEGLKVGKTIITSGKENIYDGENLLNN